MTLIHRTSIRWALFAVAAAVVAITVVAAWPLHVVVAHADSDANASGHLFCAVCAASATLSTDDCRALPNASDPSGSIDRAKPVAPHEHWPLCAAGPRAPPHSG